MRLSCPDRLRVNAGSLETSAAGVEYGDRLFQLMSLALALPANPLRRAGEYFPQIALTYTLSRGVSNLCNELGYDEATQYDLALLCMTLLVSRNVSVVCLPPDRQTLERAATHVAQAIDALKTLSPLSLTFGGENNLAALREVHRWLSAQRRQLPSRGRKPAVMKRRIAHAVAGLLRRKKLPVTYAHDPPSRFIQLATCVARELGEPCSESTIAHAAREGEVNAFGEAGKVWGPESGASALGMIGAPIFPYYNAALEYGKATNGELIVTVRLIDAAIDNQTPTNRSE